MSIKPIKLLHISYIIFVLCPCLISTLIKKDPGPLPVNVAGRPELATSCSTPKAWLEALIPRALVPLLSLSEAAATDVSLTDRSLH